jgi:hypothetical protein
MMQNPDVQTVLAQLSPMHAHASLPPQGDTNQDAMFIIGSAQQPLKILQEALWKATHKTLQGGWVRQATTSRQQERTTVAGVCCSLRSTPGAYMRLD